MPLKKIVIFIFSTLISFQYHNSQASNSFACLIEPNQTVNIRSPIVGVLEKVYVKRSDIVKNGQPLVQLESSVEIAATKLAQFKASMAAPIKTAENKVLFAQKKYQRHLNMHSKNYISSQKLEETQSELKLAQSELEMAHENNQLAKLEYEHQNAQLKLRTIRSPFTGLVLEQNIDPGEVVEPGGQNQSILKLAQLDPLRIYVILPMSAFGKIEKGMKTSIRPEIPIGTQYEGKVDIIDKVVDAASGTFGVYIEMPNPDLTVPTGVKCQAEFPIEIE